MHVLIRASLIYTRAIGELGAGKVSSDTRLEKPTILDAANVDDSEFCTKVFSMISFGLIDRLVTQGEGLTKTKARQSRPTIYST